MSFGPEDVAAIRAAEQALARAFEEADPTAWVEHYTEDALFVGPGGSAVEGRDALLALAGQMPRMSSLQIEPVTTDGDGDIAVVVADATWVSGTPGPEAGIARVRGAMVWRRGDDGRWRVARELLTTAPAADDAA